MKQLTVISLLILTGLCAACGTGPTLNSSANPGTTTGLLQGLPQAPQEAVLLVSLEDGSVIMQRISSSADICFKVNSNSATTCLTQGAPVISPETDAVIGYEMIEEQIDLVARSN